MNARFPGRLPIEGKVSVLTICSDDHINTEPTPSLTGKPMESGKFSSFPYDGDTSIQSGKCLAVPGP